MAADLGTGATIAFGTSAWTANITSIKAPERSREAVKTSHLGTTTAHTYIAARLIESGEVSFDYQYDLATSGESPMDGAEELVTITPYTGPAITFQGFWTKDGQEIPMEDLMTGSATVKVTGDVGYGTGS